MTTGGFCRDRCEHRLHDFGRAVLAGSAGLVAGASLIVAPVPLEFETIGGNAWFCCPLVPSVVTNGFPPPPPPDVVAFRSTLLDDGDLTERRRADDRLDLDRVQP